jgi:actin-related protein
MIVCLTWCLCLYRHDWLVVEPECEDEIGGAVGCVLSCLLQCSQDIRRALIRHVVICGGGADIPGTSRATIAVSRSYLIDLLMCLSGVAAEVWGRLGHFTQGKCELLSPTAESSGEPSDKFPYVQRYASLRHLLSPCRADPSTPLQSPCVGDEQEGEEVSLSSGTMFCRSHLAWVGGSLFASMKVG